MKRCVVVGLLAAVLFGREANAQVFELFPVRSVEYRERRFAGAFAAASGTYATGAIQLGLAPGSNSIRSNTAMPLAAIGVVGIPLPVGESPRDLAVGAIGMGRVWVWIEGRSGAPTILLANDLRAPIPWTVGPVSAPAIDCDSTLCIVALQGPAGAVHLAALLPTMTPQTVTSLIPPDPMANATAPLLAPAVVIVPGATRTVVVAVNVEAAGVRQVKLHRVSLGAGVPVLPTFLPPMTPITLPSRNIAAEAPTLARSPMGYAVAVRVDPGAHVYRGSVSGSLSPPSVIGASADGTISDVQLASNGAALYLGYLERGVGLPRPAMLREITAGGAPFWAALRRVALRDVTADRVRFASGAPPLLTFDGPPMRGAPVEARGIFAGDQCVSEHDCVVVDGARRCARACLSGVCATTLGMCEPIADDAGVVDGGAIEAGVSDGGEIEAGPALDSSADVVDASADAGSIDSERDAAVDRDVHANSTPIGVRFSGGACSCSIVASRSSDTRGFAAGVVCVALVSSFTRSARRRRRRA